MENLEAATDALIVAKTKEAAAKRDRIAAEVQVADLVDLLDGVHGSKTVDVGNGTKVTVKRGMIYKADVKEIRSLDLGMELMPIKVVDPIPVGYILDERAYELLRKSHPDEFAKVAQHVEATPRKVSVTIRVA